MAWKEVSAMETIMSFVLKVKAGVFSFSGLCRQHEISRETGYKWWRRFRAEGIAGIYERSCRPHFCPHQSSEQWVGPVVGLRVRHSHWGPKKLWSKLAARYGLEELPAASTLGRILVRKGLVRTEVLAQAHDHVRPDAGRSDKMRPMARRRRSFAGRRH